MSINFKSEEEVKDYVKNLGTEYRFGCYQEKKPEVCHLLGDYFESIDKDHEKAWKVYQNNCDTANFAKSCFKCGNYLAIGRGGQKQDRTKALEYFEKSCTHGDMNGCFRAGILSAIISTAKDPIRTFKQAMALFEKGCEGKHHESCYHLSGVFMEGYEREKIAKDMKRCFDYTLKACDLDNMYACANLSLMYQKGDGVEKNPELAKKYRTKAEDLQEAVVKQRQLMFQEGLNRT
ncbi:Cytochrome c oxidase assembly factor 7 [Homalodisca vitripennis]|nr:Cytochrome c oxidase assembly factor 7 [Homalodisca vitripennis]